MSSLMSSPASLPSREAITPSTGEEAETISKHLGNASCMPRGRTGQTHCPQATQKGPLLGRGSCEQQWDRTAHYLGRLRPLPGRAVEEDFREQEEAFGGLLEVRCLSGP